jgi:CheY-like chemotaxis protein
VSGRTVNVLVVDDQEAIRDTLQTALDDEGFAVETAANGREALEILGRWKPCVVLLDLMMPVMDGWAFRQEMLKSEELASIPVVVMTAATAARAAAIAARAIIYKPLHMSRVMDVVQEHCPDGAR